MANYYEILGVNPSANSPEIKAAFRKLAMMYHPDKNPETREYFSTILKAYETLSDPTKRTTYDYRLEYNLPQKEHSASKKSNTKDWSADEKELKRRRYYDEHIKKYAKENPEAQPIKTQNKKHYNEFKYILFATPLAALLFLLIMKLASPANKTLAAEATPVIKNEIVNMNNGASPYSAYFGEPVYSTENELSLKIKNRCGHDIIVCLFSAEKFIRSFFLQSDYAAEVPQLPENPLQIRYCSGKIFKSNALQQNGQQIGAFTQNPIYYVSSDFVKLNPAQELTLLPGTNEGFNVIDKTEFFKKLN